MQKLKRGKNMRKNRLTSNVRTSLFMLSYSPLFFIIALREFSNNKEYLHWGGFKWGAGVTFFEKFLFPTILVIFIVYGFIGTYIFLRNISSSISENGTDVILKKIDNKNSETISYIATYIIPFLFTDFSKIIDMISISIVFLMIFSLYVNSSLLIINPILNIKYALFEIEYKNPSNEKVTTGMLICKDRELMLDDKIRIKDIGFKINYGELKEDAE